MAGNTCGVQRVESKISAAATVSYYHQPLSNFNSEIQHIPPPVPEGLIQPSFRGQGSAELLDQNLNAEHYDDCTKIANSINLESSDNSNKKVVFISCSRCGVIYQFCGTE